MLTVSCLDEVSNKEGESGYQHMWTLDINVIDKEPLLFFEELSKFLCSLKHHKLKDKGTGEALCVLHDTLRKTVTAVNNCWSKWNRAPATEFASALSQFMSNKKKKEAQDKADGKIPNKGGREEMTFALYLELDAGI